MYSSQTDVPRGLTPNIPTPHEAHGGYAGERIVEAVNNEQQMELSDLRKVLASLEEVLQPVLRPADQPANSVLDAKANAPQVRSPLLDNVKSLSAQIRAARFQVDALLARVDL